jgi:hypothetical protein
MLYQLGKEDVAGCVAPATTAILLEDEAHSDKSIEVPSCCCPRCRNGGGKVSEAISVNAPSPVIGDLPEAGVETNER